MAGLLATTLGALPALCLQQVSQQAEDGLLGFAAGMMLAASAFSLILPGLAAAGPYLTQPQQVHFLLPQPLALVCC